MIYRFRHAIIGPLAIFWLIVTVASVITGAVAWSRFSRRVDASADPDQFRGSINQLQQITWVAGLLGVGAGLFALYFYRVDYRQERARRELLEETGYSFTEVHFLGNTAANPGVLGNITGLFIARGGKKTAEPSLDENEEIELLLKPLEDVRQMLLQNQVKQSMHALCLFYGFEWLRQSPQ
jgi:8-oxo-dGTP pyrophosphatase MutT (NUDIX family)